ncbi:unnamed protein product [Trichobilharzia szidati]|nr:unnamed protein product [Trichobilharzia szidati]
MYEAKCLDVKVKEDGVMYFVHYQGWNKNWDEWVTEKRMFKYNEEGLRKQKELERQIKSGKVKVLRKSDLKSQSLPPPEVLEDVERTLKPGQVKQEEDAPKAKSVKTNKETNGKTDTRVPADLKETEDIKPAIKCCEDSHTPSTQSVTVSSRRRKGRVSSALKSLENEDGLLSQPRLSMSLPPSLKSWLIDDWDLITRQARVSNLQLRYIIQSGKQFPIFERWSKFVNLVINLVIWMLHSMYFGSPWFRVIRNVLILSVGWLATVAPRWVENRNEP